MTIVQLVVGFVLLMGGGEALVKGSVAVARHLGVSPLVIGLTLVGFGTSTPELVASVQAALIGAPGIAVGNVVGSNIANTLLIVGVSAVILPIATTRDAFRRDGSVLVGASVLLLAVALYGFLHRWMGVAFLALLTAYLVYTYVSERRREDASARMHAAKAEDVPGLSSHGMGPGMGILLAAAGIAGVVLGADLLVGAALAIARAAGISEAVIGLTLVAVGTSLPEMVTSVMAAIRRHADVAFGNIVGSNIFNVLGIAGVAAVVSPFEIPPEIVRFDIWVMVGTALLLVLFAVTRWRVSRREGAVFLALYAAYLGIQFLPGARALLGIP